MILDLSMRGWAWMPLDESAWSQKKFKPWSK